MRYYTCLSSLFLIAIVLSSCLPAPAPPEQRQAAEATPSADSVTISFGAPENERIPYERLMAQFTADNPDIRVRFVALDTAGEAGAEAALHQAATAADTALVPSAALALAPNPAAYLRDLQPFIDADPAFDPQDFYPGALTTAPHDTAIYGVARAVGVRLLLYNQDLWDRAGLATPAPGWTWDEVLAAAEQLARKRGDEVEVYGLLGDWGSPGDVLAAVFEEAGVDLVAPAVEARLDQPAAIAALERVADLVNSGAVYLAPLASDALTTTLHASVFQELIGAGRVALWPAALDSGAPKPFAVGVARFPPSGVPWFAGTSHYVMSAGTQYPEAAWRWLAFLSRQHIDAGPSSGLHRCAGCAGAPVACPAAWLLGYPRGGDGHSWCCRSRPRGARNTSAGAPHRSRHAAGTRGGTGRCARRGAAGCAGADRGAIGASGAPGDVRGAALADVRPCGHQRRDADARGRRRRYDGYHLPVSTIRA